MATKAKKNSAVKEKKLFADLNYSIDSMEGCCGVGVVHGFEEDIGYYDWNIRGTAYPRKKYTTRLEQAEACYKKFMKETKLGGFHDSYEQLLITLVSKYKNDAKPPQFQELQDVLIREGWTIYSVFINHRHGNELTLFGLARPEVLDIHGGSSDGDIDDDDY